MLTHADLVRLADAQWYYEIELADGLVTPGYRHVNIVLVRELLRHCHLQNQVCLDIGTQEFVSPVLMNRQGAQNVVAYDRLSLLDRYEAIQQVYEVEFDYVHGLALQHLKAGLRERGLPTRFDFVNFSGVMYHLVDPLVGLAIARSFVREGGLMLMESAVLRSAEYICEFNHRGERYPGYNYFLVSTATLDYWLRMLRLEVLDCAYVGDNDICRVAAVCRAVPEVVAEPQDDWMRGARLTTDFSSYGLDFDELRSSDPLVPYQPHPHVQRISHDGLNSLDIHATLAKSGHLPLNSELLRLNRRDQY
ncbi:MAG: DUF1698 domain-containing protein [Planctomycetaceae bacterium]|nr:DUF1698 domain-containing protein [Planctomycetaceae bacterium]